MGCVQCRSAEEIAAAARSEEIDRALNLEREALKHYRELKVVVLGSRDSGKSTLIRNMKLVMAGMSEEERESYKSAVISNAVRALLALVQGAGIVSDDDVDKLTEISRQPKISMTTELAAVLQRLWSNEEVKELLKGETGAQMEDYQHHFINSLDRIMQPHFCPTDADILHVKVNSANGISLEATWYYKRVQWQVYELGGSIDNLGRLLQKYFQHGILEHSVLLLCASLDGYDTDDLAGTLELVYKLSQCKTAAVVVLTKQDRFLKKLETMPLQNYYPEYEPGPQDGSETALQFIRREFRAKAGSWPVAYFHDSCTIDTNSVLLLYHTILELFTWTGPLI